jgi:hypothetical protein
VALGDLRGEAHSAGKIGLAAEKELWVVALDGIADSRDNCEHIGSHIHDSEVGDKPARKVVAVAEVDMDLKEPVAYSGPGVDPGTQEVVAVAALGFAGFEVAEVL